MTDISFRDVATHMDRLYPPTSMRDLLKRFRYPDVAPGSLPSPPNSFREVATRIANGSNPQIEFVHYNAWLLEARLDLETFVKGVIGIPHFVVCLVGDAVQVLGKALESVDTDDICDTLFPPVVEVCGVSANPANDACKLAAAATSDLVEYLLAHFNGAEEALEWLFDHFEWGFDWAIDLILELTGLNLSIPMRSTPQMDDRAVEIGAEVFSYDWVSLCEVWDGRRRGEILSQGPPVDSFTGPSEPSPGDWQVLGGGLLVFSPTFPLENKGAHTYQTAGVHRQMAAGCDLGALVDTDIWARKGIQVSALEAGDARIDLYTTHLYSGGQLLDWPALGLPEPTDGEKVSVREAQVDELVEFIRQTHDPRHVAIVAGDFNIAGAEPEYATLAKLNDISSLFPGFENSRFGFDDWWNLEVFKKVFPTDDVEFGTQGHTNRHGDGNDPIIDTFDSICAVFSRDQAKPESGNQNDFYCDERGAYDKNATGNRIDYILIERPTELHSFMLDVSRVRRRAFKRTGSHTEPQFFLSDHLGLEVSLFVSPGP
jgi:exonuclease III